GILGLVSRGRELQATMVGCGAILLLLGAACGIAGIMALGSSLTPFPKPSVRTQLVQRGIYARVRHPLYLAVICAALGWSLVWQSWPALAASLVLAFYLDAKARREERWLQEQFPEYARYRERVRRFIPGVY
ncbi:MAG: methyltransferase family protein, partial [Verrucomicrobiota bacterium]